MLRQILEHPLTLLLVAFGLGCATHAVTSTVIVAAQSDPTQNVYRECFGVDLRGAGINDAVAIPSGWHVAGGGATNGHGLVVLCR